MKKLGFVKQVFLVGLTISSSFTNASPLSCVSMNNQVCKGRPEIINVNSDNPVFYPFSIRTVMVVVIILMIHTQKYVFPDVAKDLNIKVFDLMSRTNETRHITRYMWTRCHFL